MRCKWVNLNNDEYVKYHDNEWGREVHDDYLLFELLILEIFQAGLSFEIVLKKRKYLKDAFDNFDFNKISKYDDKKIKELMDNPHIIRNKRKIQSVIINAKVYKNIISEYSSFDKYIWSFTNNKVLYGNGTLSKNELSDKIALDLKRRRMSFIGSTTIYSYLQAIGIIYDHDETCFMYKNH